MSKNDITGDNLKSRPNSKAFDEHFDKIFGVRCVKCNGSGFVMFDPDYPFGDGCSAERVECPECDGGRVYK